MGQWPARPPPFGEPRCEEGSMPELVKHPLHGMFPPQKRILISMEGLQFTVFIFLQSPLSGHCFSPFLVLYLTWHLHPTHDRNRPLSAALSSPDLDVFDYFIFEVCG